MMNDLNIYGRISDLFYKDMLGLADEEEKRELDSLLVTYKLKGLDREKIIARLQEQEVFDGKEAYREFRALKQLGGRNRRLIWWTSIAASVVVLVVAGWWFGREPEPKSGNVQIMAEAIQPGQSRAVVTLADGQQIVLEQANRKIEESDGTVLHSDSGALVYTANAEKTVAKVMYNKVSIPRGGEYRLVLADGTKVWLNSFSELRYPVNFTGKKREVILAGEAYFDVVGDPEHPFVVKVNDLDISVLGTQFNVNAYTAGIVKTVLVEGRVNLRGRMGEIDLHPRQMGEYRETDGNLHMMEVDVLPHVAWKDGNFIFRSESLEDIMDKLSIWYNLDVFYTNDELRGIRLSGNLFRYGDVNQLFTLFEKISDARFQVEGKSVVISCK